jgi:hypothetical protein
MIRTFFARMGLIVMAGGALASPAMAGAGSIADVEIFDRTAGRSLPVYWHGGRHYVAGQPGHEYEVRLRNNGDERVLAVTSVDGVNVISGETASPAQSGYVLNRYDALSVAGWRKSMARTAAFYFTALPDSYAARTDRPHDVGVIGVALFRESRRYRLHERDAEIAARAPASPPAPSADRARAESRAGSAPSEQSAAGAYDGVVQSPRVQEKLGTGHGRSEWSSASYTQFERASRTPDEIVTIYYDSHANLVASGVLPPPMHPHGPRAFPAGFVPDPR